MCCISSQGKIPPGGGMHESLVRAQFGEPKILVLRNEDFSFVPQAQHHLSEGQHHFERSENIITSRGTNERCCGKPQMMCFAMMLRFAQTD